MAFMLLIFGVLIGFSMIVFLILWMTLLVHSALRGTATLATSRRSIPCIIDLFKRANANTAVIYDLGCGKGNVTIALKRAFPDAQVIGIDVDPIQVYSARLKAFSLRQSITFRRVDLFSISLTDATCVFAYLPLTMMPVIGSKLFNELKPGATVITNATKFTKWTPINSVENFFVFRKI